MILFKEHQYLLMRRECLTVLGHKLSNLWLLTGVLIATFFSVAFSAASTAYLNEKMNDPFTNWVNIDLNGADDEVIRQLELMLDDTSVQDRFGYNSVQTEVNSSMNFVTTDGHPKIFSTLFYESLSNDLISAVLDEDNLVGECTIKPESIAEGSIGVIMTSEALISLGYSLSNLPSFVDYHSKSVNADTLGLPMLEDQIYARAPLPLLAVVKRLPMNKEIVASKYLNEVRIKAGSDCPIDLCHENYAKELFYFVSDKVRNFTFDSLKVCLPSDLTRCIVEVLEQPQVFNKFQSWERGSIMRVYVAPGTPLKVINDLENAINRCYSSVRVRRIYNYDTVEISGYTIRDNVISVHFVHLDSIGSFEHFVKDCSGLQIEMTQVNAKKNFWAVSRMANILTAAMIMFSVVSIIIFIVNMMQNYFQQVKRNLGTFKAFGVSTDELTKVYVILIVGIVMLSLVVSMMVVWWVELLIPLRDGQFKYLVLWNNMTPWVVGVIIISAVISVLFVMHKLLRRTPGNLIYDR